MGKRKETVRCIGRKEGETYEMCSELLRYFQYTRTYTHARTHARALRDRLIYCHRTHGAESFLRS
jgi:hypothetical protein